MLYLPVICVLVKKTKIRFLSSNNVLYLVNFVTETLYICIKNIDITNSLLYFIVIFKNILQIYYPLKKWIFMQKA